MLRIYVLAGTFQPPRSSMHQCGDEPRRHCQGRPPETRAGGLEMLRAQ